MGSTDSGLRESRGTGFAWASLGFGGVAVGLLLVSCAGMWFPRYGLAIAVSMVPVQAMAAVFALGTGVWGYRSGRLPAVLGVGAALGWFVVAGLGIAAAVGFVGFLAAVFVLTT